MNNSIFSKTLIAAAIAGFASTAAFAYGPTSTSATTDQTGSGNVANVYQESVTDSTISVYQNGLGNQFLQYSDGVNTFSTQLSTTRGTVNSSVTGNANAFRVFQGAGSDSKATVNAVGDLNQVQLFQNGSTNTVKVDLGAAGANKDSKGSIFVLRQTGGTGNNMTVDLQNVDNSGRGFVNKLVQGGNVNSTVSLTERNTKNTATTIDQNNETGSTAIVSRISSQLDEATIDQAGGVNDYASVNQHLNNGAGSTIVKIQQAVVATSGSVGGASPTFGNYATVDQSSSEGANVDIKQTDRGSGSKRAVIEQSNVGISRINLIQDGTVGEFANLKQYGNLLSNSRDNLIQVTQGSGGGHSADVTQTGTVSRSNIYLDQKTYTNTDSTAGGGRSTETGATASGSHATLTQTATTDSVMYVAQRGINGDVVGNQSGSWNEFTLTQVGMGDYANISQIGTGSGDATKNFASILQQAAGASAYVMQNGNTNTATVRQF